jgi:hypothetical protein
VGRLAAVLAAGVLIATSGRGCGVPEGPKLRGSAPVRRMPGLTTRDPVDGRHARTRQREGASPLRTKQGERPSGNATRPAPRAYRQTGREKKQARSPAGPGVSTVGPDRSTEEPVRRTAEPVEAPERPVGPTEQSARTPEPQQVPEPLPTAEEPAGERPPPPPAPPRSGEFTPDPTP